MERSGIGKQSRQVVDVLEAAADHDGPMTQPTAMQRRGLPDSDIRMGVALGLSSYAFWGLVTIYWRFVNHVPLLEILGHRALWALVASGAWLAWSGGFGGVRAAFADRRAIRTLALSSAILFLNWAMFVWAVGWGSTLDVSFGYFINPLMSVVIGVVALSERLNAAQKISVALAAIAVAAQGLLLGVFPFVALWLAGTFAIYGYLRKTVAVRAAPGLFIESLFQLPVALAIIAWVEVGGHGHFGSDAFTTAMLLGTGPITALPLIMFAAAAQRLKLATMGLMQYIVPSLQFLLAVAIFGEPLNWVKLGTFVIIWLALMIFTTDALKREYSSG